MTKNINYQHLYYFWNVVKEGSFTKAGKKLGLAQPTISGQILTFEKSMGSTLISRNGRNISLTETGHIVFNYAQKIFMLGDKMSDDVRFASYSDHHRLVIGCRNSIPSSILCKITQFAFDKIEENRLNCFIENNEEILNGLTRNQFDMIITDEPISYVNGAPVNVQCLIDSEISALCNTEKIDSYLNNFPLLMERVPCIVPTHTTRLRTLLEEWFAQLKVRPIIFCEIENYDLIINMARNSPYLIFAPSIISKELSEQIDFSEIYKVPDLRLKYYSATLNQKIDKDLLGYLIKKCQSIYT